MALVLRRAASWLTAANQSPLTLVLGCLVLAFVLGLHLTTTIGATAKAHQRIMHHDEVVFAKVASRMAVEGDLNPGWFGHPGSTQIYPLALAYRLTRGDHPVDSDEFLYSLAARSVSYGIFFAALVAVFVLSRATVGALPALAAMGLFTAPLMLSHAPFLRNDGTSVLFTALALAAARAATKSSSPGRHVLFGVSLGAAIATKYYLAFVAFAYVGTILELRARGLTWLQCRGLCGWVLAAAAVSLVVFAPFLLLDFGLAARYFEFQVGWTSPTQPKLTFGPQLAYFLGQLWQTHGLWLLPVALGVWASAKRRDRVAVAAGAGSAVYMLVISMTNAYYARWLLPLFAVTAWLASIGIALVAGQARRLAGMAFASQHRTKHSLSAHAPR